MEIWIYRLFVEASVLLMLGVGSLQDLKKREVEDYVWFMAAPAAALNLYTVVAGPQLVNTTIWLVELALLTGLGLLFYYLGLFGGADAKALIALAASMPQPIPPFMSQVALFGVTVFDNGVVLAVLYSALFALTNTFRAFFVKGYFGRYAKAPLHTKLGLSLYAYKTTVKKYVESSYKLFLAEKPVSKQGEIEFRPIHGFRIDSEEQAVNDLRALLESGRLKPEDEIWVSQGLPLILFLFLGMLITPLTGDLVYHLVRLFVR